MRLLKIALPGMAFSALIFAQVRELKPGFNLFSNQQDIQMGKEAAAEVGKTMPVVDNAELRDYLTRIGTRLAKSKRAGPFPYTFSVINDRSINAFALPGGPMFVHTGLILAADNESQIAGVLAHEMSHVALRHGTNQASKANLLQLPTMLASSIFGQGGGSGQSSLWGSLSQLGIGLGTQSVLLKYSRNAERDADLNGAQMMNEAGYNPVEMARFFDKLEADGKQNDSMLANFLSDHPTPGRRIDYIEDQNKFLPKMQYSESEPQTLARMKQIVASLPPPPAAKSAAPQGGDALRPAQVRPSGKYKRYENTSYRINYPENWEASGDKDGHILTVAPRGALIAGPNNQTQIGYGMIASYFIPDAAGIDLSRETANLAAQLQKGSQGLKRSADPQRAVQVAGQKALLTPMESPSPYGGEIEMDMLMTTARPEGLFYALFIVPKSEWDAFTKDLNNMLGSLQFGK